MFLLGSSHCGSEETYLSSNHEDAGSSWASLSGLRVWCCCELWCRPAAAGLIGPLAWESPYARDVALRKLKKGCFYYLVFISYDFHVDLTSVIIQ